MADGRRATARLDAEIARHVATAGRVAAAVLELEQHPGHRLLTLHEPTGRTGQWWATARVALAALWTELAAYQAALAQARDVRRRRRRPGPHEHDELQRLLHTPSVEVARCAVALPDGGLAGSAGTIETVTLDELAARMDATCREVSEVVLRCAATHDAVLAALAVAVPRLAEARAAAGELLTPADPMAATLADLDGRLADLGRRCAHDPLALAEADDPAAALFAEVDDVHTAVSELAELRRRWPERLAALRDAIAEVEAQAVEEAAARHAALERIADAGLAAPADRLRTLQRMLGELPDVPGWTRRDIRCRELATAVERADHELRAARDQATALLERRAELRGRFAAYQARAGRLGIGERPDVVVADERVRALLWIRPCDLAAATRELARYQRLVRSAESGPGGAP